MPVAAHARKRKRLFALGAAGLSLAAAAVVIIPAANAAPSETQQAATPASQEAGSTEVISSPNWAGYVVLGKPHAYSSVSSSWIQPAVTCGSETTYSGYWIGLDGAQNAGLEQTGTEGLCVKGKPVYGAWYDVQPAARVKYANLTLNPGDRITATVTYNKRAKTYTMTLEDRTQHWKKSTVRTGSAGSDNSSAEVIVETPSVSSGPNKSGTPTKLSRFSTVRFRYTTVNGNPMPNDATPVVMAHGNTIAAEPSLLSGSSFSLTWKSY